MDCPAGRFGHLPGLVEPDSTAGAATGTYCIACPSGRYLPFSGRVSNSTTDPNVNCLHCGLGKYLPHTGAKSPTECKKCGAGYYTDEIARKAATTVLGVCSRMQVKNSSLQTSPLELLPAVTACSATVPCTGDQTCIFSQSACKGCATGLYTNEEGLTKNSDCKKCPIGKYGEEIGAYKEGSSNDLPQFCKHCPTGFYNNVEGISAIGVCKQCLLGRYSKGDGKGSLNDACLRCPTGRFSSVLPTHTDPVSENECQRCAKGKLLTTSGNDNIDDCVDCPAGKFEPSYGQGQACKDCPTGFYTNELGRSDLLLHCKQCGLGRYSDTTGASTESEGCKLCPVGKYSKELPTIKTPIFRDDCTDCPAGRFGVFEGLIAADSTTGAHSNTYCIACSPGKYLEETGQSSATKCKNCALGKYLMSTGGHTSALCKNCPKGRFGNTTGISSVDGVTGVCGKNVTVISLSTQQTGTGLIKHPSRC